MIAGRSAPTAQMCEGLCQHDNYSVQGTTHLNLNSGFFYLKANQRTISLMERIAARLAKEKAWDQVGQFTFTVILWCTLLTLAGTWTLASMLLDLISGVRPAQQLQSPSLLPTAHWARTAQFRSRPEGFFSLSELLCVLTSPCNGRSTHELLDCSLCTTRRCSSFRMGATAAPKSLSGPWTSWSS